MLKKENIEYDYSTLIASINNCIKEKKFERALRLITLASKIAYHYNFLEYFSDIRLEKSIQEIAKLNFQETLISGSRNKVLFFDYFCYDNRGLTQQYLRALIQLGKEIIYVLEQSNPSTTSSDIFKELRAYEKATIYCLEGTSNLEMITEVIQIVKKENPSKVFLHIAPWDVVACTAFNTITGVTRYQINLTDHAFWLGTNITDINLEFRSFGYNLSAQKRGIEKSKLKILPYYPILSQNTFKGFPIQTKGKKVVFSGGSMYKILGNNLLFLHTVKRMLSIDNDLVFIFAGTGNTKPVVDFIKEFKLEDKIFLIGDRSDLNSVFNNVDYYITTFPMTGGLISQIAAATKTPIFFFSTKNLQCNNLADLFFKESHLESFDDADDLIERFKMVYKKKGFLEDYSNALCKSIITPNEFAKGLDQIINTGTPYVFLEKEYNVSQHQKLFFDYLLESENLYNPQYEYLVSNCLATSSERNTYLKSYYKREQSKNLKSNKVRYMKNFFRVIFPKAQESVL